MNYTTKDPQFDEDNGETLSSDLRWKLTLRVSESKEFSRSVRLRDFLKYVCWNSLHGRTRELHEQQIGRAVFDRRPDYNPAEDNIVRVEARELRRRLDRYFARKGSAEPIRISVPKGSYAAIFEPNIRSEDRKDSSPNPAGRDDLASQLPTFINKLTGTVSYSVGLWAIAFVVILAVFVGFRWLNSKNDVEGSSTQSFASRADPAAAVWHSLFPAGSTLNIVSADSSLVLVQDILHRDISLSYYLSGQYGHDPRYPVLQRIAPNPYIDLSDLRVSNKIMEAIRPLGMKTHIRYPRYINLTALDTRNLVFLGSAYSDLWIKKLHPQMNFVVQMDRTTGNLCFVNKEPEAGELDRYCATGGPGQEDVTYALVTFLPNLQHTGHVLILAGTTGAGTEAAGDFMTDPHYVTLLRRYLNLKPHTRAIPYFQILLKTGVLKNDPGELKVVAHRLIPRHSS